MCAKHKRGRHSSKTKDADLKVYFVERRLYPVGRAQPLSAAKAKNGLHRSSRPEPVR